MDPTGINTRHLSGTVNYTSKKARRLTGTTGQQDVLNANSSKMNPTGMNTRHQSGTVNYASRSDNRLRPILVANSSECGLG